MGNTIRLKRRVSGQPGAPATLKNGECAYNEVSDELWYGKGVGQDGNATSVVCIGGEGVYATKAFVSSAVSAIDVSSQLTNYLTKTEAASTYLTVSAASSTYLTQSTASSTYAPLASPALTGNPTAPTQASSDNSTKLATTGYVQAVVSALINSAPGTLDTLGEIATALGNDPNLATTLTSSIAGKLAKASNLSDLTDASTARSNLGLGSMATQSSSSVSISGGTIDGVDISGGSY